MVDGTLSGFAAVVETSCSHFSVAAVREGVGELTLETNSVYPKGGLVCFRTDDQPCGDDRREGGGGGSGG